MSAQFKFFFDYAILVLLIFKTAKNTIFIPLLYIWTLLWTQKVLQWWFGMFGSFPWCQKVILFKFTLDGLRAQWMNIFDNIIPFYLDLILTKSNFYPFIMIWDHFGGLYRPKKSVNGFWGCLGYCLSARRSFTLLT